MKTKRIYQNLTVVVIAVWMIYLQAIPISAQPVRQEESQESVQVVLETPSYNPETQEYQLIIRIDQPEKVDAIEVILENADLEQAIATFPPIPVLGYSTLTYSIPMRGRPAGEYRVKVRAIDFHGRYFHRQQQYGSGNPLDLAVASIKYQPPQPEKPTFSIISVSPDLENGILYIRLDIPEGQDILSYEGFVLDEGGREIAQYPETEYTGNVIREVLPPTLASATTPGKYKVLLYLTNSQGIRSDPQEFEFEFSPPPRPSFFKRVIIAIKTHPGILMGIVLIILLLVLWILIKNRKGKKKTTTLPRPPVDKTFLQNAGGAPSTPSGSRPKARPFANVLTPEHPYSTPHSRARFPHHAPPIPPSTPESPSPHHQTLYEARVELIVVKTENYAGPEQITITQFPFFVGRSKCDLTLKDPQVSRRHLRIDLQQDQVFVMDLDSKNGTFLDGQRLTPHKPYPLTRKVTIRLGGKTVLDLVPQAS